MKRHRILLETIGLALWAASCGPVEWLPVDGDSEEDAGSRLPDRRYRARRDVEDDAAPSPAFHGDDEWADPPTTKTLLTVSNAVFLNPDRGFYRWIDLVRDRDFHWVREQGSTLGKSYVRLDDFRESDLPASLLDDLSAGLDAARDAGIKVILRFSYNFGPYPDSEPDASKERVLAHIAQLRPLFVDNEDVIAVMHAGFIGAWGEWHTSTNGLLDDPLDKFEILEALLGALPPSRMVQIRYPFHKQEGYGGPISASSAYSGSIASRIGHHNDCFLASDTDWGTYPSGQADMWRSYLAADTLYVPMGGETCNPNPPRSECASALAEMELLHYSYVHQDYHPDVVSSWSAGGCREEMERRLGYRFAATEITAPIKAPPGSVLDVSIRVTNDGWAAPFNSRAPWITLTGPERLRAELPGVDPRRWLPGTAHDVSMRVQLPSNLSSGQYSIGLWLPDASTRLRDDPRYAVRLANEGAWDPETGINTMSTVDIDPSARGGVDLDAVSFVVIDVRDDAVPVPRS